MELLLHRTVRGRRQPFHAMPSARNRVYGLQVYKYGIEGILHWGFNFYNSAFSLRHLNSYEVTDCDGSFPSGDAFLVYPGPDGVPEESIRLMVLYEAIQDHRALKLLEQYIVMGVRNKINRLIKKNTYKKKFFRRMDISCVFRIHYDRIKLLRLYKFIIG